MAACPNSGSGFIRFTSLTSPCELMRTIIITCSWMCSARALAGYLGSTFFTSNAREARGESRTGSGGAAALLFPADDCCCPDRKATALSVTQQIRSLLRYFITSPSLYAALPNTGCVQCEHRRASIGISLRHSGHFLVVGSGGFSPRCMRAINVLTGSTTKK
jgi:hypothetical protein